MLACERESSAPPNGVAAAALKIREKRFVSCGKLQITRKTSLGKSKTFPYVTLTFKETI
jgi:hypothetical protein